jgi:DNA-binding transcriptional LysR family regulator
MYQELFATRGLSLDRLKAFAEVAAAGGIAKAAQGDPIRQSQLSRQIRELESFFAVSLTAKKGRTIMLTPAGETLAEIIRHIFTHLTDFKQSQHSQTLGISLGSGESILQWLVLPKIKEIKTRLPAVVFSFRNLRTNEVVHALQECSLDLGLLRTDAVPKELCADPLGILRYKIFVPARWANGRTNLCWTDALKLPFVGLEGESQLMGKMQQAAKAKRKPLRIELLCSSLPAIVTALARLDAATVLPTVGSGIGAQGDLVAVNAPFLSEFDRPLSMVWNPRQANVRPSADKARGELTKLLRIASRE